MKSILNVGLTFIVFAVMAVSCTESRAEFEDLDETTTRATSTSLILASPTQISFSNAVIGDTQKVDVTVVSAGLTPLTVLTAFDIIVQGADASEFEIERPSLSLIGVLQALLGNGYTFTVAYTPTTLEPVEATVLVNASILGILLPTQLEIPINGTLAKGPQLVSGGEIAKFIGFDPEDPTVALFEIELTFDRQVTLADSTAVNGPTPGFFKRVFTNARNLAAQAAIAVSQIENFTGTIYIDVDALIDENGDPLQQGITLDFTLGDIL
ncbi:MAG: hypothetical protein E6772_14660 [Dysgonomonas sp.]|nr:hypothetical protein [Dysgonomonas sp.]